MDKIEVKTNFGTLVAEKSNDPDNPGIWLSVRDGNGIESNIALFESPDNNHLRLAVWGDENKEDYTNNFVLNCREDEE